jgi:hypothetical protein
MSLTIKAATGRVTLATNGAGPSAQIAFQLPQFVDNLATTSSGRIDQSTGTVLLSPGTSRVTVSLEHPVP